MNRHVELEELSALLDGELEAPRANIVREHLAGCAACDQRRAGLERSAQTATGTSGPTPSACNSWATAPAQSKSWAYESCPCSSATAERR